MDNETLLTSKLKTLLDLKQKEINVQEARATRQIAQGNEKQSKASADRALPHPSSILFSNLSLLDYPYLHNRNNCIRKY